MILKVMIQVFNMIFSSLKRTIEKKKQHRLSYFFPLYFYTRIITDLKEINWDSILKILPQMNSIYHCFNMRLFSFSKKPLFPMSVSIQCYYSSSLSIFNITSRRRKKRSKISHLFYQNILTSLASLTFYYSPEVKKKCQCQLSSLLWFQVKISGISSCFQLRGFSSPHLIFNRSSLKTNLKRLVLFYFF